MTRELALRTVPDVALVDQLEAELAKVADAAEAEQFWRIVSAADVAARVVRMEAAEQLRYGKLRLRAERRWGELLGPAENHGPATVTRSHGSTEAERKARERARDVFDVPPQVFDAYLDAVKDPEVLRRARLLRIAREKEAAARAATAQAEDFAIDAIEIRHGDFRERLGDLEGTVDAIITDPPYAAEFLPLYPDLARTAAELLRPTGSLVVLCGTRPDAWLRLIPEMEKHITLRWVGCYLAGGPAWRDHRAKIATNWKPVLIFGGNRNLNSDVWRSRAESAQTRTKDVAWHRWGQNLDGFVELVDAFTSPGDLVVDPFLGGGTTAVAARNLGRRFVGCDTDPEAIAATEERLAA